MHRFSLAIAALALTAMPALAKDMQFWNQTSHEFTGVRLAPAGTTQWGGEQTDNDPDHAVSADERLRLAGVTPGKYDVKLTEKGGRVCVVHGVELKAAGKVAFAIEEKQLTDCTK
jgi:hypothetical protein